MPSPTSPQPLIRLSALSKSYATGPDSVEVLRDIDLSVSEGELVVILGPSGSGKTTILNMVGGIDSPTSGEVVVDGRPLGGLTDSELTRYRRDSVGYIFQFYNLIPTLTALENVALALELQGRPSKEGGAKAARLLGHVGLSGFEGRFPAQLSGGEQQRVAIARALAKEPRIVVADEPTGNLDKANSAAIRDLLGRLNLELGTTILMATHDESYKKVARRVVYIEDGRLTEDSVSREALAEETTSHGLDPGPSPGDEDGDREGSDTGVMSGGES